MSEEVKQKTVQPDTAVKLVGRIWRVNNNGGAEVVIDNGIALKDIKRGEWLIYDPATTTQSELLGAIFSE